MALAGGAVMLAPLLDACRAPDATPSPSEPAATRAPVTSTPRPPSPSLAATAQPTPTEKAMLAHIAMVKTSDRAEGVRRALELLGVNPVRGKRVLLKPNFNSADPAPGSTHADVLRALVVRLHDMGAQSITVADRSGMGDTRAVMRDKGVHAMAEELGFGVLAFDDLEGKDWVLRESRDFHWARGYAVPRLLLDAECVVQTCNLKTHRFGGHFTLSLKNSVGLAAKTVPGDRYDYMSELHGSRHQRHMIAEINMAYQPALIVMDGVEAFTHGGPDTGTQARPEVVLAGADRVAIDAVGVALLRMFGTTGDVNRGKIFEQEQIARAVELGLGVDSPDRIAFVTGDPESEAYAGKIREELKL
jgi:uncharacterized protein (DUF362 family)